MAGAGLAVPLTVSLLRSEDLSVCAIAINISPRWSESESLWHLKVEFTVVSFRCHSVDGWATVAN
jgi:hypothetical protein